MRSPAQPGIALGTLISDDPQSVVGSRGRRIQSYVALRSALYCCWPGWVPL